MSTYSYSKTARNMTIMLPILIMGVLLLGAIYGIAADHDFALAKLILYTMPVLLASSFIGLHHPTSVTITDDRIMFSAFGRSHTYKWEELDHLYLRNYSYVGKTLIRLGKPQIFGGRYWITNEMSGYKELIDRLEQKSVKGVSS